MLDFRLIDFIVELVLSVLGNVKLEVLQRDETYLIPIVKDGLNKSPNISAFLLSVTKGECELLKVNEVFQQISYQVCLKVYTPSLQ